MLSEMEQRIRECCDAFLEAVTEDRDLWEIALLGKPVEWRMGQTDDRYGLLRGLLDQEKVRLLYDGVRGGDSRCGDMLTELLTSGAVTRGAQEKEGTEQLKDLEPEEDLVFSEDEAQYPFDQLREDPGDE